MSQGPALASVLVATMVRADRSVDLEGIFEDAELLGRMEVDDVQIQLSFGGSSCFYISTSPYRILCPGIFHCAVFKMP
jgi:hypothetical protein